MKERSFWVLACRGIAARLQRRCNAVASGVEDGRAGRKAKINHQDTKNAKTREQVRSETLRTATGMVALPNHFDTMNQMEKVWKAEHGGRRAVSSEQRAKKDHRTTDYKTTGHKEKS
jgi:hypothetical protein